MIAFAFVLAAAAMIPEGEKPEPVVACTLESGEIVFQEGPCPVVAAKPASPKPEPAPAPIAKPVRRPRPSSKLAALLEEWSRPPQRPKPNGPPDPRFATPEKTWARFVEAVKGGKPALAAECLAPGVELPANGIADLDRARPHGANGDFWPLRVPSSKGRSRWILLERGYDGAWRIAAL